MEAEAPRLDPMTEAALKSLKDIAVPEPISWLPQTWGWAMLAGLLGLALLFIGLRRLRRYRANAYRREALLHLLDVEERMSDPARRHEGIHALAELLKRVALAGWSRKEVASMSGSSWVRFLGDHDDTPSEPALATLLDDFEYRDDGTLDTMPSNVESDLTTAARRWIGGHRVST
ncbi:MULTISPECIES: DUF4381 domain-containing protein [unclassified Rhizobium]|uniref:DUF4381 domain-containing protein n=1 Tax=unclassified Rhizobium TaxID=2613769 RepID=UPI001ADA0CE2|nr:MULTISPECIES: DUF4381 domain-containing protein [unclassified Rhizobium]MBO9100966.1 DUF4381 domain-containing protein [Rhizobium sp. L58/93]MBO9170736.1 DUF4381 domain-containing protein [Rhizobium sp. L245/93]MBO9186559.1 DUF4381 domain-containing protein [Rhizobium sp. E27B/91]QXZ86155.1 DUF4381 domain-containing protein [Rhizobium sp. K1/93]QXZ92389.1 DUF4381 domain-containing protein [Rhizobium sp. K15/93]